MHRLPLSLPDRTAPDTVLNRLCGAIGTHPFAVALAVNGWKPVPWHYTRAGDGDLSWFVDSDVPRAHALCAAWELPAGAAKSLPVASPSSPFLAAMCALENLAALEQWGRTGERARFERCGSFLRPVRGSGLAVHDDQSPVKAFTGFTEAAALVACGFLPWGQLGQRGPFPLVAFAENSLTFPGLRVGDVERACHGSDSPLALRTLPGFPAEEHPFFYALQAVRSLASFRRAQDVARRHPRVVIKSKNSPASVVATGDLLREGRRDSQAFRDAVHRHLKKSA